MSTDKQVPLTIEDCRCIIEDSETERETRLARAHIELLAAHAKTQEQLEGALENASDIAVKLGVECDDMTDAQMWHASVQAIVKLRGQLADADFGYGGWNSIRTRIEAERDVLREQLDALKSLKVMQEIVVLREQLAQALRDTERLAGLLPRGLYLRWGSRKLRSREDVDAALRAKQEPPQALPPTEGSAEDAGAFQGGHE